MIIAEEDYLAHYGKKGMKWGVRRAQAASAAKTTGRVAWAGTKAVGRGTKKAAIWSKDHPKEAAAIGVGALIAAKMIKGKVGKVKLSAVKGSGPRPPVTNKGYKFVSTRVNKAMAMKFPTMVPKNKPQISSLLKAKTLKDTHGPKTATVLFNKHNKIGTGGTHWQPGSDARKLYKTTFKG